MKTHRQNQLKLSVLVWYSILYSTRYKKIDVILVQCPFKWPRYFYSRWCPTGGPRDPTVENHFPSRILQWILHHICMDYKKSQFWKRKWKLKCCTVLKWRRNNQFLFRVISIVAKMWKTTFPNEFFNEIWLKVEEHEYIYITEITF